MSTDIEIVANDGRLSAKELNELYEVVGWNRKKLRTEEKTKTMLGQTTFFVTARAGGKLVGFGRVMGDVYVAQIFDVIVEQSFRRQGVGRRIMKALADFVRGRDYIGVILVNGSGVSGFYERFGFEKASDVLMYLEGSWVRKA